MQTPLSVIEEYIRRHNFGVRTRNFAPLLELFDEHAELHFRGIPLGPFHGRALVARAFAEYPPDDEIRCVRMERVADDRRLTLLWKSASAAQAGTLEFMITDLRIRHLVIAIEP